MSKPHGLKGYAYSMRLQPSGYPCDELWDNAPVWFRGEDQRDELLAFDSFMDPKDKGRPMTDDEFAKWQEEIRNRQCMWVLQFVSRQRSWLLAAGALMNHRVGIEYHLEGDRRDDGWGDISINVEFAQYDTEDWALVKSDMNGHGITVPLSLGRALMYVSDVQKEVARRMFKGEGAYYDKENEKWVMKIFHPPWRMVLRQELWDDLEDAYNSICEAEDIVAGHKLPSITFKDAVDSYALGVPGLVQGQRRWRGDE